MRIHSDEEEKVMRQLWSDCDARLWRGEESCCGRTWVKVWSFSLSFPVIKGQREQERLSWTKEEEWSQRQSPQFPEVNLACGCQIEFFFSAATVCNKRIKRDPIRIQPAYIGERKRAQDTLGLYIGFFSVVWCALKVGIAKMSLREERRRGKSTINSY